MGRSTLDAAIASVLNQEVPADEIIVIAGGAPVISRANLKKVQIVENFHGDNSIWTAAHNRNVGVKYSSSKYVAFLDDDDEWHPQKMQTQISFLLKNSRFVSISSARYLVRNFFAYRRPLTVLKPDQSVLDAHYGKRRIFPTPYYAPTPGIVVPSSIAKEIPFDEDLLGFEDTWWLHEIQLKGFKIMQHREALVTVNASPIRSISRDSMIKNLSWARKLQEVDSQLAINYLSGICLRNAILGRRWKEVASYLDTKSLLRQK